MPWSTLPAHPTSSSSLFSPFSSSSSFCQLSFLNVILSLTFRLSGNKTWFWTVQIFILLNRRKLATASRNGAVHRVGRNVVRRCALKLTGIGAGWPRQRWSKFFFLAALPANPLLVVWGPASIGEPFCCCCLLLTEEFLKDLWIHRRAKIGFLVEGKRNIRLRA